ncbi:hypothetical protein A1F94_004620 [Pyrenophora tritici-repentis]|uniref:Uncharacterized protein n=1 Tax=Pyrenophora tritici-repentis TaxID=45151 RepID=A0A5M9LC62_9PLEO|nr:hypothetical protein PtrV1_06959 [Pyrenophora tritici-repentis]KAF7448007.1 hypothetical protein A1F99_073710 [Pyrenophora tritici-repentis]KAF7571717.1 hypothetical protein PtrM4_092170 [Pyrenophora tritici-repentis]KAG9385073.1 hypothetical protein A1F94_004620 [Pyrenophora tritici-repentis]KAI0572534.1 hypothetical protein Alg130_10467 [Pyrenophora tritici-repentis]
MERDIDCFWGDIHTNAEAMHESIENVIDLAL